MTESRILAISPRLELFFALAAVLSGGEAGGQADGVRRWLDQARRRLDQSFRRRLGHHARSPEFWRRLAALGLPREAALGADADGVIAAVAAAPSERFRPAPEPEALQRLVVEVLRRFDRLAFGALWRPWRQELGADARRIEASLRDLPVDVHASRARSAIFLPSHFAPPHFTALIDGGETVLLAFDPDQLPPARSSPASLPRADTAAARRDPAPVFRALGDATRYTVAGLIAREPMTSAELARRLGISKPTMAHHLRALREAGLVHEEARGTRIVLTLDRGALESLSRDALAQFFGPDVVAQIRRSRRAAP